MVCWEYKNRSTICISMSAICMQMMAFMSNMKSMSSDIYIFPLPHYLELCQIPAISTQHWTSKFLIQHFSLSPFSRCTKVRLAPIFLISANPSLYSRLWKGEVMSCVQNFSNALCRQTAWEKTFDLVPGSDKKQTDPRVCRRRDLDLSFGTQLRYRSYKEAAT